MPAFQHLPWIPSADMLLQAMLRGGQLGAEQRMHQQAQHEEGVRNAQHIWAQMQAMKEHGAQASERNQAIAERLQERLQEAEARDHQRKEQFQEREARLGEKENRLEEQAKATLGQKQEQQDAVERYRQAVLNQKDSQLKLSEGDKIISQMANEDYTAALKGLQENPNDPNAQQAVISARQVLTGLANKYQSQIQPQNQTQTGTAPSVAPPTAAGPVPWMQPWNPPWAQAQQSGQPAPTQTQTQAAPAAPAYTVDPGSLADPNLLASSELGAQSGGQRLGDVGQGQTQQAPQMPPEGSIVRRKSDNATGTVVNGQFVWHQPPQGPGKTYMGDYLNSPDSEANGPGAQPALVAPPDQGQ